MWNLDWNDSARVIENSSYRKFELSTFDLWKFDCIYITIEICSFFVFVTWTRKIFVSLVIYNFKIQQKDIEIINTHFHFQGELSERKGCRSTMNLLADTDKCKRPLPPSQTPKRPISCTPSNTKSRTLKNFATPSTKFSASKKNCKLIFWSVYNFFQFVILIFYNSECKNFLFEF